MTRASRDYVGRYMLRHERQAFAYANFAGEIRGPVLDVGCDERSLRGYLPPGTRYIGVDHFGAPTVRADLLSGSLPFHDRSVDSVVCLDTLEHLDAIHHAFDELCRVAGRTVLVSLPNPLELPFRIRLAAGTIVSGKYGLSPDPPPDRHRWFFTYEQARRFVRERGPSNGFVVRRELAYYRDVGRLAPFAAAARRLGAFPGAFAMAYWALLQREG